MQFEFLANTIRIKICHKFRACGQLQIWFKQNIWIRITNKIGISTRSQCRSLTPIVIPPKAIPIATRPINILTTTYITRKLTNSRKLYCCETSQLRKWVAWRANSAKIPTPLRKTTYEKSSCTYIQQTFWAQRRKVRYKRILDSSLWIGWSESLMTIKFSQPHFI